MTDLDRFLDAVPLVLHRHISAVFESLHSDSNAQMNAEEELASVVHKLNVVAHLRGRVSAWDAVDRIRAGKFDDDRFSLPFEEAIDDILGREPRVVPEGVVDRAYWISELYGREKAFAAARSMTDTLTRKVQSIVASLMQEGKAAPRTEQEIMRAAKKEGVEWTVNYTATVLETNLSTNFHEGRFQQAADPVVREAIPALMFVAQEDERTRPNHFAGHGTIAAVDDPVWQRLKPPLGYRCRCGTDFVPFDQVEGKPLPRYSADIANAGPDPKFKPGAF